MNTRKKGYRAEVEFRNILKALGYEVWRPTQGKWGNKDIFGLFDLIAVLNDTGKRDPPTKRSLKENWDHYFYARKHIEYLEELFGNLSLFSLLLVQVKTNQNDYYTAVKQIEKWSENKEPIVVAGEYEDDPVDFGGVGLVVALRMGTRKWRVYAIPLGDESGIDVLWEHEKDLKSFEDVKCID